MGCVTQLAKSVRVTATEAQRGVEVLDGGANRYAYIEFIVERIEGSPTSGSVTIVLETATVNEGFRYKQCKDIANSAISIAVNFNDSVNTVTAVVTDRFARYLRWRVSDFSFQGGSGWAVTFSMNVVFKDA